jgi:hypothetical protein
VRRASRPTSDIPAIMISPDEQLYYTSRKAHQHHIHGLTGVANSALAEWQPSTAEFRKRLYPGCRRQK